MFAKTSTPSTSKVAFLLALLLLFALSTAALAAPLANGEFSTIRTCSLASWTTTGDVMAVYGSTSGFNATGSDCVARIRASLDSMHPISAASTLSQSFEVPTGTEPGAQSLTFNLWVASQNGISSYSTPDDLSYGAQNVTVQDASQNNICSKSRNITMLSNQTAIFSCDLSAYAGQTVTLTIRASASSFTFAPDWTTIYVDAVRFGPTSIGGGGNFGW